MSKFIIKWPVQLNWRVKVSWSKNATLPIMSAALLNKWITVLKNVPDISDIQTMISIFEFLNVKTDFKNNTLTINASKLISKKIPHKYVCKLRWAIVLLGPLLARTWEVQIAFPWWCVIWKRPIDSHLQAFEDMWCEIIKADTLIHIKRKKIKDSKFCLKEISVTASENAISFAAWVNNNMEISLCAAEPHVQDLCNFLKKLWTKINWSWTHFIKTQWQSEIKKDIQYTITGDYLEVWTFAVWAAISWWNVIIEAAIENQLDTFWLKMKEAWVKFDHRKNEVEIFPSKNLKAVNIKTWVFPDFATDLQAPFSLIQCKATWVSKIFETLFEKRLNYLFELEKMWAHIEWLSPYRAMIVWWKDLKASQVSSCDLRAWAAMVLAALIAEWETEVLNIYYIDRWYENFEQKLRSLWADIRRVD